MSRTFEYVVDGIVLTTVSVFGLVGTLLSIRVLLKPSLRNSFSTLIVGLAACDANFLLFAILIIGLPKTWLWYQEQVSVHLMPVCNGLISLARTGSVYLTMAVTLERYFAIVKPLSHFGPKKFLLPSALLFAALYNIPRFFELKKAVFSYTNETMVVATELRQHPAYISYYMFWSKVIFLEMIPYVTIIALNARIVQQIFSSSRFRRSFQRSSVKAVVKNGRKDLGNPEEHSLVTLSPIAQEQQQQQDQCSISRRLSCFSSGSLQSDMGLRIERENAESLGDRGNEKHPRLSSSSSLVLDEALDFQEEPPITAQVAKRACKEIENLSGGGGDAVTSKVPNVQQQPPPQPIQKQLDQEISLGVTLVSISVLFIFCQSVKIIPDLYELTCREDARQCLSTPFIETLTSISNLLSCFNSAANFLIYMLRGKKFRDVFLESYGCRRNRRQHQLQQQQSHLQLLQQQQQQQHGSPQSTALTSVCSRQTVVARQQLQKPTDTTNGRV